MRLTKIYRCKINKNFCKIIKKAWKKPQKWKMVISMLRKTVCIQNQYVLIRII